MTVTDTTDEVTVVDTTGTNAEAVLAANEDGTVVRDDEWSVADAVDITLTGDGATTTGDGVEVSGTTVTITAAGVYHLSGSLEGSVTVSAAEDAQVVLILDGVDIANPDGAAISVFTADDVAVSLADGTQNTLSDAATYAEDADVNAALFSEADLTITGTGALTVRGNGGDGITSRRRSRDPLRRHHRHGCRRRTARQGLADDRGRHADARGRGRRAQE